ncbi:unnamed protein product [Dovyalis caffra]|uniref:GATA-type domain-containing protein n=1 Tax=Dovyalis caffra TaxID=77055 RepID=A0AAV1SQI9_9ROSI|nr:unnamed protein product [Dovyalis caffra]
MPYTLFTTMAIDDENIFDISDLRMLNDFDWTGSELCVPQDPIECIPSFPDFYYGLISSNELNLLEDVEKYFFRNSEEEKQTTLNDCKLGITNKKPRSKRTSKQCAWSMKEFMFPAIENHPEMSLVHFSKRRCTHCGMDSTPQWRIGPLGPKTLCNACGVRYKTGRLVPEYRPAASPSFDEKRHSNFPKQILKKRANLN